MVDRQTVYQVIDGERSYQEVQRRKNGWDKTHTTAEFLVLIGRYLRKAEDVWCDGASETAEDFLRKIAAIAVAGMEQNGAPPRVVPEYDKPPF